MIKNKISEDEILEAAWKLLAKEGIESFSMRKLSQLLNIKAPSLYWYVKSKEEIFNKLASQVIREILAEVTESQDWQEQLLNYGEVIDQHLRKYPYSAHLLLRITPDNVDLVRLNNELLKVIDSLPFEDSQKFASITAFLNYMISFEIDYLAQKDNLSKMDQETEGVLDQTLADYDSKDPVYRIIKGGILESMGSEETFRWGLMTFVDGLAVRAEKRK